MINVKYDDVEHLIKEGYVLLFRGKSILGRLIERLGVSPYSHVGVASWSNGTRDPVLEMLEYREFSGSRAIALKNAVNDHPGEIDVFIPASRVERTSYDNDHKIIRVETHLFNGKRITSAFRRYTGLRYSYERILFMLWFHIPFLRLFTGKRVFDDRLQNDPILPVCSTSVAHFFSKHYTDLVKFKSDEYVEPGDLARSPLLSYLFTLNP